MSTVLHQLDPARFPGPPARATAAEANPHVYTFGQVGFRLGIKARQQGWQIGYVDALTRSQGFPRPLPRYNHRRKAMSDEIGTFSRWQRDLVDAWFEGNLPPGARDALMRAVEIRDLEALDANAADLHTRLAARRA